MDKLGKFAYNNPNLLYFYKGLPHLVFNSLRTGFDKQKIFQHIGGEN